MSLREGRVIGLASKMSGSVALSEERARDNVDWVLMIPSRGTLMTSSEGQAARPNLEYPEDRLGLDIALSAPIIYGTRDFAGLTGYFVEEADIERVDETGQVYGQVTLRYRMQGGTQ